MANWAITDYVIEGPDDILKKINDAIENHQVKEGSSDNWEGNILDALEIPFENRPEEDSWYMRGFVEDHNLTNDGKLTIYAEEAWGATDFRKALKEKFPEITVYFVTEEQGCSVFETNDKEGKYFTDRYFAEANLDPIYNYDYFQTKDEALRYLSNMTDGRVKTEEDIDKFNEDEYENNHSVNLYEYKIVD